MEKDALRQQMRLQLASLRPLVRAQQEDLVNAVVVSDASWQEAQTVLVFRGVRSEISVVGATNHAFRTGKRVCFPRVAPGGLVVHEVEGWDELSPGAYGIPEPAASAPVVSPATIDVALVPGLAFTPGGRRLGQGGGYYDRLLPALGGESWGVCFDLQVLDALPQETHDRPVDRVVWAAGIGHDER